MKALLPLLLAAVSFAGSSDTASLYALKAKSIDGKGVALSKYRGKVAMVVNTASKCGYTPQYKQLQALYDGEIGWNFTKFLVDQDGRVAARFPSKVKPDDPRVLAELERLLKKSLTRPP